MWMAGTQVLEPSSATFLDILAGRWMGSGETRTKLAPWYGMLALQMSAHSILTFLIPMFSVLPSRVHKHLLQAFSLLSLQIYVRKTWYLPLSSSWFGGLKNWYLGKGVLYCYESKYLWPHLQDTNLELLILMHSKAENSHSGVFGWGAADGVPTQKEVPTPWRMAWVPALPSRFWYSCVNLLYYWLHRFLSVCSLENLNVLIKNENLMLQMLMASKLLLIMVEANYKGNTLGNNVSVS